MRCPKCETENPDDYGFCIQCGTPLTGDPAAAPSDAPPAKRSATRRADRRVVVGAGIALTIVLLCAIGVGLFVVIQVAVPDLFSGKRAKGAKPTPIFADEPPEGDTAPASGLDRLQVWGPDAAERFLEPEDFEQLTAIASDFTHPLRRPLVTDTVTIASLVNTPSSYAEKTVLVSGRVLKRTLLYDLMPEDWPRSYLLVVDDGTASIPVVYRGYAQEIDVGDPVEVRGYLSQQGGGIHADLVSQVGLWTELTRSPRRLALLGILAGVVALAFAALSAVLLWLASRWAKVRVEAKVKR